MGKEDLGDLIIENENFNPTPIREKLGLEKKPAEELPESEIRRLANLLRRTGNLDDEEVAKLGMIIRITN